MSKYLKRAYLGILLFFLYAPIIVLMVFSFNESRTRVKWTGFSLKWYIELFHDDGIMNALSNTISIALLSAIIATIIGTAAALGMSSMKKRNRKIVMAITNLPVLNPDIVIGISLMILFIFAQSLFGFIKMGYVTLLLSHITFNIPYVILSVMPKVRQMDKSLYEAAQDLGATPFQAFRKAMIPQLMPGIFTGALFAFTLSLDDFIISFFTTGAGVSNLSILIYTNAAKKGINPKINALSTIMLITVMLLLVLINKRENNEQKAGKKKNKLVAKG